MTYKVITTEPIVADNDEDKRIEETTQVEQVRTFSIAQLKREIVQCEEEITRNQERKAELEAKITAVVADLDLKLEAIIAK